ncbi:MAG: hypothetical protein PHS41_10025 [Victivallaceae bacterium]|nr:hypothetical protein [Victivallaceae bacterium]
MQVINRILRISGAEADLCDEAGRLAPELAIKIGVCVLLRFDLRSDRFDDNDKLTFYPVAELAAARSFYFCLDGDWDHQTQPPLLRLSGCRVFQDSDGRTIFEAELPDTATVALLEEIAVAGKIAVTAEFGGFVSTAAEAVFSWSVNLTLLNRVYLGGSTESQSSDPEYLNAAEVRALIAAQLGQQLSVGTVAAGSTASASITGTAPAQVLNLVLPKGASGDNGASAYELAQSLGYKGTLPEWIASLKGAPGADGKGLEYDASGTVAERSLYDGEEAGFRYAATQVDSTAKTTTLYFYTKLSATSGDWSNPLVITLFATESTSVAAREALAFAPPSGGANYFEISLASCPNAMVAQVTVTTSEGELTLPYYSDFGILRILRNNNLARIYFGAHVPAYTAGKIYLSQLVSAAAGTVEVSPGSDDPIYFGYVTDDSLTSASEVSATHLEQTTVHSSSATTLGKTSCGTVPAGSFVIVLVPTANPGTATKDDGFGGKVAFSLNNGAAGTGANGADVTIGGKSYKVYGEFKLNAAEVFIYVD